jgi:chromosomal replication initiator protein
MQEQNKILWESVIQSLSEKYQVSETDINTWLKPSEITDINAAEIHIKCVNKFYIRQIEEHYLSNIQKILEEEFSIKAKVKLFFDPSVPKGKKETKETGTKPVKTAKPVTGLDPFLTFERFVEGDSNLFAYRASLAVADGNFSLYNPLFIYGGVGLGKTHLMNAVGNRLCESFPKTKVLYIESKDFMQEVVNIFFPSKGGDLTQEKVLAMRERYAAADLLMMDDFQLLDGAKSQEMFFNIFNELNKLKKQIIVTADKTPQELDIEERLRSRFTSGLLVGIDPPSLEEKVAILRKKADEKNIVIDQDTAFFLSENIKIDDVRRLEGVLKTAYLTASLDNAPISKDYVLRVLKEQKLLKADDFFVPTSDALINAVTEIYNIKKADLYSTKRTKNIAHIRQIAMYLLRDKLNLSLKEIGSIFGGKDHSTVSYAVTQVAKQLEDDAHLKEVLSKILEKARNH